MSQTATSQKQVTYLLIAAAVLLAAIIGVLVWQNANSSSSTVASQVDPAADGSAQPPAGMGDAEPPADMGAGQAPQVDFDPATAPAVPEGQSPEEFVTAYYEACENKDYATAYSLLPVASQQYYGDAASFEATLEGYGVSGYVVEEAVENGDTISVIGGQEAQGMLVKYEWTFVRVDDGTLRVQSRTMAF